MKKYKNKKWILNNKSCNSSWYLILKKLPKKTIYIARIFRQKLNFSIKMDIKN